MFQRFKALPVAGTVPELRQAMEGIVVAAAVAAVVEAVVEAEAVAADVWDAQQQALWQRIQAHVLDLPEAPFPFSRRLAQDNHWSPDYAARVVAEYRRFVFLAMVAGHPVTPSDQVDQAWHLHLLYTRDYWGAFTALLPRPLHHGPTLGGTKERHKFSDWYSKTRHSYRRFFGEHPPIDIWPPDHERFGRDVHWKRVNTRDYWLIPRLGFDKGLDWRRCVLESP